MSAECAGREERLVALLYDDGDPHELAETRAHLATCEACRTEFEALTSTRELLGGWADVGTVPRMVYVNGPSGDSDSARDGARPQSRARFGPFLPSLAAAAAVILVFLASAPFLRFQMGADGSMRLALGSSAPSASPASALVTRDDLDRSLTQTVDYLETLMRRGREQDRRDVLAAVDQALNDQNAAMGEQVGTAISSAFDEIDRRRRADLNVMLSSMNDLQVITQTELRQFNAMLASLMPAAPTDKE